MKFVERLIDPATLPRIKLASNALEAELAQDGRHKFVRPINIDPGYVTEAKLVLATTKDRDHRIYLGEGIYGEVTLFYQQHRWNASRWKDRNYGPLPNRCGKRRRQCGMLRRAAMHKRVAARCSSCVMRRRWKRSARWHVGLRMISTTY